MKVNIEMLTKLLEALVDKPVHAKACRRVGIDRKTFYRAMDNPDHVFEWNGRTQHFGKHVALAMRMNAMNIEAKAREMAVDGFEEVVTKDGKICWVEDERIINEGNGDADKETLMLLYGQPDIYLRDPITRARVPIKLRRAPPAQLVNKMLSAHFPKLYGDRTEIKHTNGTGVMVVGNSLKPSLPPPVVDVTPKQVIQRASTPKLEDAAEPDELAPATPGYLTEPPDDDETDLIGAPPVARRDPSAMSAPEPVNAEPTAPPNGEPEPEEMTAGADGKPAEPITSPAEAKQNCRAQWEALLAASKKNTAHKRPTAMVDTGRSLLSDTSSATK